MFIHCIIVAAELVAKQSARFKKLDSYMKSHQSSIEGRSMDDCSFMGREIKAQKWKNFSASCK